MSNEMIEKTITIPRYTVRYDEGAEPPAYCVAAPTIYGAEWWIDRRRGELTKCGCKEVDAPDWKTVEEALNHYGEHLKDLNHSKSLSSRYLRIFHGVKNVQLITSAVDQYSWAIVMGTDSWREHVGLGPEAPDVEGNPEAQLYLDGAIYYVTDELTGESLWGIYADSEQEALRIFKSHYVTDQEATK